MSENESTEPTTEEPTATEPVEGEDQLGDAGKKALDRMKADKKAAQETAKAAQAELAALKAQLAEATARGDAVADVEKVVEAKAAEIAAQYQAKVAAAEIKAAAVGKVIDVDLVASLPEFNPTNFLTESGEVDQVKVAEAIDGLVTSKPYLAAQGQGVKGAGDGGARNGSTPSQLTRTDLSRMTPEEIRQAHDEGRLNAVLSGK